MEEEGVGKYDFLKIKDLTFKMSLVYDWHHFHGGQLNLNKEKTYQKKGGDLDDEGGIDRQYREGGQNLKSVS
jgi:hypothetical protein